MDTDGDGASDETFTVTVANKYASVFETWRKSGANLTWKDNDDDDNLDSDETIGPPLAG